VVAVEKDRYKLVSKLERAVDKGNAAALVSFFIFDAVADVKFHSGHFRCSVGGASSAIRPIFDRSAMHIGEPWQCELVHTAYGCPKNALCEEIDERAMLVAAAAVCREGDCHVGILSLEFAATVTT